ncbi:sensor histidine kinase [Clostridium scatologenes]|uniref:sensor histidine kinase n=1 Tax=Clostridium scatologenes TaxID=1548 RepID=UPI00048A487F|nr:HAMP domain-containing sensor histidine kinase [Clostridium scatologenes]
MKILNKIRTNWSITTKFLVTLIFIIIIEFFVNLLFFRFTIIYTKKNLNTLSPESFTLNFSEYINFKDNKPFLIENAKKQISNNDTWIQIIDENLKEVYSFRKPKEVPSSYKPIDLVHIHKYDIANSSVFMSEKKYNNKSFAYIIGFPFNRVAKYTLTFNPSNTQNFIGGEFIVLMAINIVIAVIASYFIFGKRMGKPLDIIINGIDTLSKGNYEISYSEYGIYKNVFTNLNNLSKTLKENKEKREEIEKMRELWISSISHDIKTPLSSIKGYSEIMKDSDYIFSNDEIVEYSEIIYSKSLYIQTLIEDLNFTYKLKNKVIPLKREKINITLLLQNIIISILNHPCYRNRTINFHFEKENIQAFVDERLFKRALSNLIFNALIHNDENVQVDISIYEKEKICITLRDNGKGIAKKDLDYIFEKYYRGTNTNTSIEGSGLGMAISKQIIDAHGSTIRVKSNLNKGTTICIIV